MFRGADVFIITGVVIIPEFEIPKYKMENVYTNEELNWYKSAVLMYSGLSDEYLLNPGQLEQKVILHNLIQDVENGVCDIDLSIVPIISMKLCDYI